MAPVAAGLAIALHAAAACAAGGPAMPRFHSEVVRVAIADGVMTVEGDYRFTFAGTGDSLHAEIRYPFPADSLLGPPQLLAAHVVHGGGAPETLLTRGGADAWLWNMRMRRREPCRVVIRYRQPLLARHAAYVLTSTRGWRQPLVRARLEVTLPPGATQARFSLPLRRDRTEGAAGRWFLEARRFWPDRDLVVDWDAP